VAALLADFDEAGFLSRRSTSRKGRGLSRPNLDLDQTDSGRPGCLRRFEVKFQGFRQIGKRFLFGLALAATSTSRH